MKPRLLIIAVAVIVALSATLVVAAQRQGPFGAGPGMMAPRDMDRGYGCFWLGPRIAKHLNLTEDQISQLKQIRDDFVTQTQATREMIKTKVKDMVALWTVEAPDPVAIKAALAEIDVLKTELRDAGVDKAVLALGVLTAEQRAKLGELIKNHPWMALKFGVGCGMGIGRDLDEGPRGPGVGGGRGRGPHMGW